MGSARKTKAASSLRAALRARMLPAGRPRWVEPQLASRVREPPADNGWLHEMKFDGYRIEALLEEGRVRLLSRRNNDWTSRFGAIAAELQKLPAEQALLDGELAAVSAEGLTSFQELQGSFGGEPAANLVYFAFDLLFLDGHDLRRLPLLERKELLRQLLAAGAHTAEVRFSDHVIGEGPAFYESCCEMGLEGVISKRADASYAAGRTQSWLKVKCGRSQEFVIGGFTRLKHTVPEVGALLLGYNDQGLRYCGKVGTGFTDRLRRDLYRLFVSEQRRESPFVRPPRIKGALWVQPSRVAEISFTEWTNDDRLRQPVFKGLREDKEPAEVRREPGQ